MSDVAVNKEAMKTKIIDVFKDLYDPEIPVNIYDLGMIYDIIVSDEGDVHVRMTLTSPNCPAIETLPMEAKERVYSVEGVKDVELELVWDPPWGKEMMSEAAKLELNMW